MKKSIASSGSFVLIGCDLPGGMMASARRLRVKASRIWRHDGGCQIVGLRV